MFVLYAVDDLEAKSGPADEMFLLGLIAGLCNLEPRDELVQEVLIWELRARHEETRGG